MFFDKECDIAEFLEAIFKIMSIKYIQIINPVSDKDWAEIERRQQLHKQGKSKSYTWKEVKKEIQKVIYE